MKKCQCEQMHPWEGQHRTGTCQWPVAAGRGVASLGKGLCECECECVHCRDQQRRVVYTHT